MISREDALAAINRHDREISERLRAAQAAVDEAIALVAERKAERAGVIQEAVDDGWALARIGNELGISRQRVAQLRTER